MTNFERFKLADKRYRTARDALVGFATFHLPRRLLCRFAGDVGREVFIHSVVYGNRVWPRELEPQFGDAVRRAQKFLITTPRFRKLFDADFEAYMEWSDAKHQDELDSEAYERSIDETYRMIDRETIADVREECREFGLVD
jgi:hypothetical protein